MTTHTHEVPDELLSSLLSNYKKPEDLIGENVHRDRTPRKRRLPSARDRLPLLLPKKCTAEPVLLVRGRPLDNDQDWR